MDKFDAMRAFVRVVESGTFTKASETLDIPKPTVTRLIRMLEDSLSTKLLNRTTRRVSVTPDGAAYYERAVRLLGELEELEGVMTRAKANPKGRLRIDCPVPLGQTVIIPALPDFVAKYPDIDLELGFSDRPVDLIAENVDCVIRTGTLTDQSLVARRIGYVYLLITAAPSYWKRHGKPSHPAELDERHTLIRMYSTRMARPFPVLLNYGSKQIEVQGHKTIQANDVTSCVALAKAGLGVLDTVTFLAQPLLERGELEPALTNWRSTPIPVSVVYPPNRHLSMKVRVFVDWVAELFAHHPLLKDPDA